MINAITTEYYDRRIVDPVVTEKDYFGLLVEIIDLGYFQNNP